DQIAGQRHAVAVHDEDADHVVEVAVVLDDAVAAVHEVGAVAAAGDQVPGDAVPRRVPDDDVAAGAHAVALDARAGGLPEPDRIAAEAERRAAVAVDLV